jgi:hypothetical protein
MPPIGKSRISRSRCFIHERRWSSQDLGLDINVASFPRLPFGFRPPPFLTHPQIPQEEKRQAVTGDEGHSAAAGGVPQLLKVSLVRLSKEIKRKGLDSRIVACIHDSIWAEAAVEKEPEV